MYILLGQAKDDEEGDGKTASHSDGDDGKMTTTIQDVFDTLSEKQKKAVYALVGQIVEENKTNNNKIDGGNAMKHNIFEKTQEGDTLIHADVQAAIADGKRYGTMKESFLEHGITDIEFLFPDSKMSRRHLSLSLGRWAGFQKLWAEFTTLLSLVLNRCLPTLPKRTPVRRVMSRVNLRRKKYSLLKRTTTPQTVYKTQKIDRDDIVDITDFDVMSWVKGEMRMMLDEELARAFLVGDGRSGASEDKIKEDNLRPIWKDADLYTIKTPVSVPNGATDDQKAKAFIRAAVKSRKNYKGSGSPVLYTTEDVLTDALLMEDTTGRVIYDTVDKLKNALRVSDIVTVPVMENLTRTSGEKTLVPYGYNRQP